MAEKWSLRVNILATQKILLRALKVMPSLTVFVDDLTLGKVIKKVGDCHSLVQQCEALATWLIIMVLCTRLSLIPCKMSFLSANYDED